MRFRILCVFTLVFSLALFSCSESEADVVSASGTMVFDFKDTESAPSVRLAVFLQVTNEVQRTDNFTVSHEQSGYSWNVSNPKIFTGLNKNYAFSLNLNAPEGEAIPAGSYSVVYYDAAGNEDTMQFVVNYNSELLSADAENCRTFLENATENVAVYDETGELLFMGKAKNSWKTNEAILKDYRLAETKRICYVTPGNTIICMMPEEKLKTEN